MVHDTGRLLKMAARQLTIHFDQFARPYNLTGTQMSIIDHLGRIPGEILQRDLEKEFNIRRSTATLILQRMEKKQLIKRQTAQTDARQKSVQLTVKGQQLVQQISHYMQQQQAQLQQHFTKEEIAIFEKVLQYYMKA
ncbi:MAG: MarR family transcriptional regulator [Lactobacillus sp.]|nr:MarR family transcriptional regulator [Lactobacillus sp.]